jgi:hypothetical protein
MKITDILETPQGIIRNNDIPQEDIPDDTPEPEPDTSSPKSKAWSDLDAIWDGDDSECHADVAPALENGQCIFYRGTIGAVMGQPSAGKSIFLLTAEIAEALAGGRVWVLDPEDSSKRYIGRLKKFGAQKSILKNIRHCQFPSHEDFQELLAEANSLPEDQRPTMVVLDGMAVLMAQDGLKENQNDDVLAFIQTRCKPWKKLGASVILADHVTKADGGLWGRGGGAKKGEYDNATYFLKVKSQFSSKKDGVTQVILAKDRHTAIGFMGQHVFDLKVSKENEQGLQEAKIIDVRSENSEDKPFRPEHLMEQVLKYLQSAGDSSRSAIRASVSGRTQWVDLAINTLIEDGLVEIANPHEKQKRYKLAPQNTPE